MTDGSGPPAARRDSEVDGSVAIPKWFVYLASLILTLSLPWAGWVTVSLSTIGVKVEARVEAQDEMRKRIDMVDLRVLSHISDLDIHQGGIRDLSRRLDDLQRRVERLEGKSP